MKQFPKNEETNLEKPYEKTVPDNLESKDKMLSRTVPLENLGPGQIFTLDNKRGKVVVPITKGEKSIIEITWLDDKEPLGPQRLPGNTLVEIEKKKEKEIEWQKQILGDLKPNRIFRYQGKEGRILTKPMKGKKIWVRFKGNDEKEQLPWGTEVEVEKEKEG